MNKDIKIKEQGDSIFALDIGTRTVVGVYGIADEETFILKDYIIEPHPKRAMIDGQIEDIKQVAKVVAKVKSELEERNAVKLTKVSIAAAGRALKTRHVTMEFDISDHEIITADMIKAMEIETVQKAQAELDEQYKSSPIMFYCVGHSVINYSLDGYKILNLEGHKGTTASIELIATFLPNVVVEGLYSVMDINKLEVTSLTLEPIAAMNILIPQEIRLINIALVDIGAGTSDIAISKDGSIVAYAMATVAGDEITEEIIKTFFVDFGTAEQMKHDSTSGKTEITFRDIFGLTQTITLEEFTKNLCKPVDVLAKTICENIIEANGGPTAAVFLVGGGSLIEGLSQRVAEILGLDNSRVAIGTSSNFRMVDTGAKNLGAEFATPLGIAVTEILNKGYDFSVVELNENKIRIFDTKKMTVFDLLTMVGYKSHEIMGRSGRNLIYTLGGRRRTVKGGALVPSEITLNGKLANLNAYVTQGDKLHFKPAVCGENASAVLGDVFDMAQGMNGYVTFAGEKVKIGVEFTVGGETVDETYQIQPLDHIETVGILTLDDLIQSMDIEVEDIIFTINGMTAHMDDVLQDGDIIEYKSDIDEKPVSMPAETEIVSDVPEEEWGEITVSLNGGPISLPAKPDKSNHVFLELLAFIDYDPSKVNNYKILLNGEETSFMQHIKHGDKIDIKLADANGQFIQASCANPGKDASDEPVEEEIPDSEQDYVETDDSQDSGNSPDEYADDENTLKNMTDESAEISDEDTETSDEESDKQIDTK